jgi:hypothetical protein
MIKVRRHESQTLRLDCLQMRSSGDEDDFRADQVEASSNRASNSTSTVDDDPHSTDSPRRFRTDRNHVKVSL